MNASNDTRRLDLHGVPTHEAIHEFVRFYNSALRSGAHRIEVVHGWGSSGVGGAIRRELRDYLKQHATYLNNMIEGDSIGNPGMTVIFPKALLPSAAPFAFNCRTELEDAILTMCTVPRSQDKIENKLNRKWIVREIRSALNALVAKSMLQQVSEGSSTVYKTRT